MLCGADLCDCAEDSECSIHMLLAQFLLNRFLFHISSEIDYFKKKAEKRKQWRKKFNIKAKVTPTTHASSNNTISPFCHIYAM